MLRFGAHASSRRFSATFISINVHYEFDACPGDFLRNVLLLAAGYLGSHVFMRCATQRHAEPKLRARPAKLALPR